MWTCFFILILAASVRSLDINVPIKYNRTKIDSPIDRLVGGAPETAGQPYIAYIYKFDDLTYFGNGIVVSAHWVVTSTENNYNSVSMDDVYVKAGYLDPIDPNAGDGVLRVGREFIPFPNPNSNNEYVDTLALLRVCPSFPAIHYQTPLAPSLSPYRDDTLDVNMYQYYDSTGDLLLHKVQKNIAEMCECMEFDKWWLEYHVCLTVARRIYGEANDVNNLIVTEKDNNEIIGWLVNNQIRDVSNNIQQGEIVLHIGHYQQWITDNSIEIPSVY